MLKRRVKLVFAPFTVLMLLAQLMLTAAHLHVGAHGGGDARIVAQLAQGSDRNPLSPVDGDDAHCTLCWAQTLVGSLPIPPATPLPLSHASLSEPLSILAQEPADRISARAFRPRAPPPSFA